MAATSMKEPVDVPSTAANPNQEQDRPAHQVQLLTAGQALISVKP